MSGDSTFGVPAVERAMHLLHFIGDGNACSNISQVAKKTGINRTTLLRLLETLHKQRLIEPDGKNGYVLGTGLIHLASKALNSRDVVSISQPELKRLASGLGLSAHLGISEGADILYLLRETPNLHLVSNIRVGSRLPIHATTIGRILLAYQDKSERAELLRGVELFQVTDKTPTTHRQLNKQLDGDRLKGIAWSEGYFEVAIGSAAVPVFNAEGVVIAAINVTGPVNEFTSTANRRDEIESGLREAALRISMQLGFSAAEKPSKHQTGESL